MTEDQKYKIKRAIPAMAVATILMVGIAMSIKKISPALKYGIILAGLPVGYLITTRKESV